MSFSRRSVRSSSRFAAVSALGSASHRALTTQLDSTLSGQGHFGVGHRDGQCRR